MIEFSKVTDIKDIPLSIKELYHGAFPEAERRPWYDIEYRITEADPMYSFYVLKHMDKVIGFITLWRLPCALYCEHFAILPQFRGVRYGSDVVRECIRRADTMQEGVKLPFVVEVELPETSSDAFRRLQFYERCGMKALDDFPYWQPPYRRDLESVPMMLMSSRPLPDPMAFVITLHAIVYNQ